MSKQSISQVYTGILKKHIKGFGFVKCEDETLGSDIFISGRDIGDAMDGDTVEVELMPPHTWKESPQGVIRKVTVRKLTTVAGQFQKCGKYGFVVPDGKKFSEDIASLPDILTRLGRSKTGIRNRFLVLALIQA